jgi:multiple sugar transport system substrate-binding protein
MNRKILIGIIVGVIIVIIGILALAGGGGKKKSDTGSGDITLTYWRVDDDSNVMDPFFQAFEKDHPNVKIDYKKIERATYETQLLDALAAGKGPDLFQVHDTWLPRYYDKITPMPEDMYAVGDYRRDFFKAITDETVVSDKIYGIPYYMDTLGLYYNNALLLDANNSEPPRTWQELVGAEGTPPAQTMAGQLNNRQGNTFNRSAIALGTANVTRSSDILSLLMLQWRTEMVNAAKDKALFNLPQKVGTTEKHLGTDALNFYTCFADPRCPYYSWNGSQDPTQAFAQGKVAMIVGYPYLKAEITKLNPDLRVGVAKVPQVGGQDPVNYASFWPEVVSKSSQHQKEAWQLIRFMSDKDQITQYQDEAHRVSPRKDVSGLSEFTAFYEQNESATTWYKGDADKADKVFVDLIARVLRGEDAQRAIDVAANDETGILVDVKNRFARP